MPKYEIMLILDPQADVKVANEIAQSVFGKGVQKSVKMDRTELAYKINNSTTATYMLMEVETEPENIAEFTRKVNITKEVWRILAINLDAEKAAKGTGPNLTPLSERPKFNRNNKFRGGDKPRFSKPRREEK